MPEGRVTTFYSYKGRVGRTFPRRRPGRRLGPIRPFQRSRVLILMCASPLLWTHSLIWLLGSS